MGGSFDILPHGLGGISGAFAERRVVEEVGYFRTVPSVGFVVVLIELDLEVDLHL